MSIRFGIFNHGLSSTFHRPNSFLLPLVVSTSHRAPRKLAVLRLSFDFRCKFNIRFHLKLIFPICIILITSKDKKKNTDHHSSHCKTTDEHLSRLAASEFVDTCRIDIDVCHCRPLFVSNGHFLIIARLFQIKIPEWTSIMTNGTNIGIEHKLGGLHGYSIASIINQSHFKGQ